MAVRIEVCGRLANLPALRVTPAGSAVLSLVVDCGAKAGELLMPVIMTGEAARAIASRLSDGVEVHVQGALRQTYLRIRNGLASLGVEVVADQITLVDARN